MQSRTSSSDACLLLLAVLGLVGCALAGCRPLSDGPATTLHELLENREVTGRPRMRGVALGLHFRDPGRTYESWLWEARAAGASHVSLVVSWTQTDVRATEIAADPVRTPRDADVRTTIQQARALGLEVMLFPILWIEHREPGEWRGRLAPDDVAAWFASYTQFILHYAEIAAAEGVSILCIGSELGSMEAHDDAWRGVAASAREAFEGQLLYSANWDHWHRTPFWEAVDLMGVTAYHELTTRDGYRPTAEELVVALRTIREGMDEGALSRGRPLVLTEVGYTTHSDAARHPWDYSVGEAVDLGAQADLYEAFWRAWVDADALHGVFFWSWFGAGGATDDGYSPRNKPAEQWMRRWFGAEVSGAP